MGLRYSKSTSANTKAVANYAVDAADIVGSSPQKRISRSKSHVVDRASQISNNSTSAAAISIPPLVGPTINLQIEESPNDIINGANASRHGISTNAISANSSQSGSLNSVNNCARQIIIKIQLAKMENDNGNGELPNETLESLGQSAAAAASSSDLNANTYETNEQQILNANELSASTSGNGSGGQRTAGSSSLEAPQMFAETSTAAPAVFMNNNNLNGNAIEANLATSSMAALKLNTESDDEDFEVLLRTNSGRAVNEYDSSAVDDYCEVLEQPSVGEMWLKRTQESLSTSSSSSLAAHVCTEVNTSNSCCRSKGKSLSTSTSSAAAVANNNKRRCCKCKCRDAIRGLSSAAIKVLKQKEPKETSERKASHSRSVGEHRRSTPPVLQNSPSMRVQQQLQLQQRKRNSIAQMPSSSGLAPLATVASTSMAAAAAQNNTSNQVSIWTPNGSNVGDVIIRISTPQFVMEQCANAGPVVTVGRISDAPASIRLMAAAECVVPNGVVSPAHSTSSSIIGANPATVSSNQHQMGTTAANVMRCNPSRVPIAHSQIDFVHFLVPDLERITNSSFYWGKMDRYEAERLLDGMPEGTFLLRDSAQEEFLFSVTFRKYERSLHARIEQSGHKFSFDSHDPCVFTAPTVTGLLEHYKDPSCVMFFEPMLTVPLHRKNPFSLQQLCRATIVSNTTYDGVNQLELPTRLKSYLKEYHYKQKLRVKPFDEPFYSCT